MMINKPTPQCLRRSSHAFILTAWLFAGSHTEVNAEAIPTSPLVIDNFDKGTTAGPWYERTTTIGAIHGPFVQAPSKCSIRKSKEFRRGDAGLGLLVEWECKNAGWCGYYSLLENAQGKPVDVSDYTFCSFWIKGATGGESFTIGFTDHDMKKNEEDALVIGHVSDFLANPVNQEWQEVKIPLSTLSEKLDRSAMGGLVLMFESETEGTVYLEDITFTNEPSSPEAVAAIDTVE